MSTNNIRKKVQSVIHLLGIVASYNLVWDEATLFYLDICMLSLNHCDLYSS